MLFSLYLKFERITAQTLQLDLPSVVSGHGKAGFVLRSSSLKFPPLGSRACLCTVQYSMRLRPRRSKDFINDPFP